MPGADVAVRNLTHRYPTDEGEVVALDGIDVEIAAGGYVAIQGASGAGKSTLLSVLGGLEPPQEGEVAVAGHLLAALRGDALAAYRRSVVGFVFQHFGLLDELTALENVELAAAVAGRGRRGRQAVARTLLEEVGLASRASHRPAQLSGGERQRVAIARSLANDPALILADEPTGNLDPASSETVIGLLEEVRAERGCTLVVVTHDAGVARRADGRVVLDGGRVVSATGSGA